MSHVIQVTRADTPRPDTASSETRNLLPKQNVAGSSPVSRSTPCPIQVGIGAPIDCRPYPDVALRRGNGCNGNATPGMGAQAISDQSGGPFPRLAGASFQPWSAPVMRNVAVVGSL